jgi:putative ABC transport system permease protein
MKAVARIAWLQLMHHPWRLVAALSGIAFSSVLILVQTGLYTALFAGVTKLYSNLGADLVMISPQYQSQLTPEPFPRRELARVLGVPGVRSVDALYFGQTEWKNPDTHRDRAIFVVGVPPDPEVILLPGVAASIPRLTSQRGIVFDAWSRPEFGDIGKQFGASRPVETEMGSRRVTVAGMFQLGASFAVDGSVLTSYETFFSLFPERGPSEVDVGLIRLEPAADPQSVLRNLAALAGSNAEVLTRDQLVARETSYWSDSLPIGYVLAMNAILGLVVGVVIVYQILYTDVTENLSEYATLKALGFADYSLFSIVLFQGFLLSALGYIPGLAASIWLYSLTRDLTFLPLQMTAERASIVYAVVLVMCLLSAAMAMRKVKTADPAEIF